MAKRRLSCEMMWLWDYQDKSAWNSDLVCLTFPEGEARERVLVDLVKQFAKMDPEDPECLRYKLSVVECRALENVARALNDAAAEQARLRGVTREIADFAVIQMRGIIEGATITVRQLAKLSRPVFMIPSLGRQFSSATLRRRGSSSPPSSVLSSNRA